MEVILLERVAKLGQMGEVVKVRDGFARNFLLKRGKALRATNTVIEVSTSGCTAIVTFFWPITLIGESSQTCGRATVMPSAASASTMSRTETEPNSWPDSAA